MSAKPKSPGHARPWESYETMVKWAVREQLTSPARRTLRGAAEELPFDSTLRSTEARQVFLSNLLSPRQASPSQLSNLRRVCEMLDSADGTHLTDLYDTLLRGHHSAPQDLFSAHSQMRPDLFIRLDGAGEARTIDEVMVRGRALASMLLNHLTKDSTFEGLQQLLDSSPTGVPRRVSDGGGAPRYYRDAIAEAVRDLTYVAAFPPGRGGHEATRLLAMLAPISLGVDNGEAKDSANFASLAVGPTISDLVATEPLAWRLVRVATWVLRLIYGDEPGMNTAPTAHPYGELTPRVATAAINLVKNDLQSAPGTHVYDARCLSIEGASHVPHGDREVAELLAKIMVDGDRTVRERQYACDVLQRRRRLKSSEIRSLSGSGSVGLSGLVADRVDPERELFAEDVTAQKRLKATLRRDLDAFLRKPHGGDDGEDPKGRTRSNKLPEHSVAALTLIDGSRRRAWLDTLAATYRHPGFTVDAMKLLSDPKLREPGYEFLIEQAVFCGSYASQVANVEDVVAPLARTAGIVILPTAEISGTTDRADAHPLSPAYERFRNVRLAALMGIADLSHPLDLKPGIRAAVADALARRAKLFREQTACDGYPVRAVEELRGVAYALACLRDHGAESVATLEALDSSSNDRYVRIFAAWGLQRLRLTSGGNSAPERRIANPYGLVD